MNLSPERKKRNPEYPTYEDYQASRRSSLKRIGKAVGALAIAGVGILSCKPKNQPPALPPVRLEGAMRPTEPPVRPEGTMPSPNFPPVRRGGKMPAPEPPQVLGRIRAPAHSIASDPKRQLPETDSSVHAKPHCAEDSSRLKKIADTSLENRLRAVGGPRPVHLPVPNPKDSDY